MLTPIDRTRVYEAALDQIKSHIESGEWPPGSQLPAERELAERLNIGRPSVREALRVLEVMGLIEIRLGHGSFVKDRNSSAQPIQLLQSMLQEDGYVVELLEVREILEPQIAFLAAQSATDEDIRGLEEVLNRMDRVVAEGGVGIAENMEFHLGLTKAVGNRVLYQVHHMLFELSREPVERFFRVPGRMTKSLQGHREVLRAIRERDPEKAYDTMLTHLRARFAVPDSNHAAGAANGQVGDSKSSHRGGAAV